MATGIASIWAWSPAELATRTAEVEGAHPGRFVLGLGVAHAPSVQALGQYRHPLATMRAFLEGLDDAAGGTCAANPGASPPLGR